MRSAVRLLLLALTLGSTPKAWAGPYVLSEGPPASIPLAKLPFALGEMKALAMPARSPVVPGTYRYTYQAQIDKLEAELKAGTASALDRVNLSGCYLRFGRPADAIRVLTGPEVPEHFLIQANLAAAYHERGELEVAVRHQERALLLWPGAFAPWTRDQLTWFRQAEKSYLRLLNSRLAEERAKVRGLAPARLPLDPLFPGFRFVGSDLETYTAGDLAPEMIDRLPATALNTVVQLCWWRPADARLTWFLAEMLNAAGYVQASYRILDEMAFAGQGGAFEGLAEHRKVLAASVKAEQALQSTTAQVDLLALTAVPPLLPSPGLGSVGFAATISYPRYLAELAEQGLLQPHTPPPAETEGGQGPGNGLPNWRHVTIGFLSGALVTLLLAFQWQEWRRRRALKLVPEALPPDKDESLAPPSGVESRPDEGLKT